MARTKIWIAGGAAALLVAGTGAGIAAASGHGDDGEGRPITGQALDRASATALQETGGGRVTGSEVGDEEGYYEVEVTLDDGSQVDVHLDRSFKVIDSGADGGGGDDGDANGQ
jgi:uncharacterized membrane protein YkoI